MGNTLSVPEEAEEDNTCTVKSYQALSESPDTVKNGSAVFAQNHSPAMNGEVDAKASVARDNVAVSSPKTMEQGPAAEAGGQSLGSAARRAGPAAKPRSVLAFSWAVPGRTEDPATDSSLGPAKLDVSPVSPSGNKALSEGAEVPGAAVPEEGSDKNLSRAPLQDVELTVSPEGEDVATSKPKPVTFFDRIFKLEKGKERSKARGDPQEERQALDVPDGSIRAVGLQSTSNGVPQGKEIDDCNQKDLREDSAGVTSPGAAQAEKAEVKQDSPQAAAAGDNSVMSFLRTLVSPSKAEAKSDSEDKGSRAEKGHGGQPSPKAESPTKGAKKKKAESPKLGHSTFSKLFRHKAAKETQQTTNTKSPEQQPVTSVKPDKTVPPSQEPPPAKQNPKAPEAAAAPQGAASEAPREGMKEKPSATPMPLSKLFWKKNASEEAEAVSNEKTEVSFEVVAPDRAESKSPEGSEVKPRGAESKTPKTNLRKFFKLTLNATERPLAPAEGDPVGQRSKESSKDKKSTVELSKQKGSKQENREQPDPREQPAADTDSIQNGGDASKEPSYKKTEKRQSLGGFFKGLGSKRMSDAEVQTDPVSILPAGKSK
ncbi:PREDICTED: breast carcinoma-amplified sequence 1 [Lepidothrix coronata]|uniref:Breast carcinoma-amplified sequence 1 n=1 Tax=Lepidothrix coronata TaxID=321398 RepID=A0A6J0H9H2_9PASS|nr:PREDICTED: breast carcinoma-amplified sequence 1 [Lepidothrix coronata]